MRFLLKEYGHIASVMTIHELSEGERPREKMLSHGAFALSNGELLAVLLRSGRKGESVLEMAQSLLARVGGHLKRLFAMSVHELAQIPGIGPGKACSVLAAAELGRRFMMEDSGLEKKPLISARMIYELMLPHLKGIDKEECWALYLNTACYLIDKERLTLGTGTSTAFDSRDILKGALDRRAYAVVLVHNHPSGNPSPSNSDQLMTKKLRKACDKLSVSLLDHVIVADDSFYSFNEDRTYSR